MTKHTTLGVVAFAAAAIFGVVDSSQPSMAVTLTMGGGGTPYTEGGFQIDPIKTDNGNCDGVSGKPCMALNTNDSSTLTKVGGGTFTLTSFGFELLGSPAQLTVQEFLSGPTPINTFVYTQDDSKNCSTYCKNVWYVITLAAANVTSVIFSDTGTGNIRVDDIVVGNALGEGDPLATPLPAALPLFAGGLGALGLIGSRRRKRATAV
jgi:hypothetical protein